jgi:hypothetical protein
MSEKVLFFSPHAGIWVHAFPEALVADAVRAAGGELVYVTCNGALSSFCVTMGSRGLRTDSPPEEKAKVCVECRRNRDWLRQGFGFSGYDLDSVLSADDVSRIDALMSEIHREDIDALEVDGVNVGRASLYEYLIHQKKSRLELAADEWDAFRPRLASSLRSLVAAKHILDREKPSRIVMYNTLYSANAVWRALADQRRIPVYFLHAGTSLSNRLQRLIVGRDSPGRWIYGLVAAWGDYRSIPCNTEELAAVTDHFCQLFQGTNVFAYSAPKSGGGIDLRVKFGIRPEQKILVASMSSYDEYVASWAVGEMPPESGLLFKTQIEWIRSLIEWSRARPDHFLLIRVHPREFPNKREGVKSEHALMLERELASVPPNVRVNWPSDGVSLYDVAEHADVFLNAWSSAGKEMTLLGLPVVVYCPELLPYPAELNYVGLTRDSYFAAIETALREGWSFARIRQAYRWCVLEYVRSAADISDGFDFSEVRARSIAERARGLLFLVPGVREQRDLLRRPVRLRQRRRLSDVILSGKGSLLDLPAEERDEVDEATETVALRREIGRLMQALYGRVEGAPSPGSLRERLDSIRRG